MYLYLIMCLQQDAGVSVPNQFGPFENCRTYCICRRIVNAKSTQKYTTKIGQNTGTSNASESVESRARMVARVAESLGESQDVGGNSVSTGLNLPEVPFWKTSYKWAELVIP